MYHPLMQDSHEFSHLCPLGGKGGESIRQKERREHGSSNRRSDRYRYHCWEEQGGGRWARENEQRKKEINEENKEKKEG